MYPPTFLSPLPSDSIRQIPVARPPVLPTMSGRGCFNCGGCALLFLRCVPFLYTRSGLSVLESASNARSNFLAAVCCHLLPPAIAGNSSNKFCTRTSYATLFTILRNISRSPSSHPSLPSHERSPNVLLDDLDGHQAVNCPKAGTPTWYKSLIERSAELLEPYTDSAFPSPR